jgi:hypothetical protein
MLLLIFNRRKIPIEDWCHLHTCSGWSNACPATGINNLYKIIEKYLEMILTQHSQPQRKRDDILFNVKESNHSVNLWKRETGIEKLLLVPQYVFAYILMVEIYTIHYVAGKFYGIPYLMIVLVGLFGDGTTNIQLFCLIFSFWAFSTALTIPLILGTPKRLQRFYDIVGEKRVKHKLFGSPILALLKKTAPAILTTIGIDAATDAYSEHQFQKIKSEARGEAHKEWYNANKRALEIYEEALMLGMSEKRAGAIFDKEHTTAQNVFNATIKEIENMKRTTQPLMRALIQSDQSKRVIDALENVSNTTLGNVFWGKRE